MTALDGLIVILAALVGYFYWAQSPSRAYVLNREPDESVWSGLYSGENLSLAKEALAVVTTAFLLRADDASRLRPGDRLMDIYRAAYPVREPDALEFETLWREMKARLSLSDAELAQITEMTVGEVVRLWVARGGGGR